MMSYECCFHCVNSTIAYKEDETITLMITRIGCLHFVLAFFSSPLASSSLFNFSENVRCCHFHFMLLFFHFFPHLIDLDNLFADLFKLAMKSSMFHGFTL